MQRFLPAWLSEHNPDHAGARASRQRKRHFTAPLNIIMRQRYATSRKLQYTAYHAKYSARILLISRV